MSSPVERERGEREREKREEREREREREAQGDGMREGGGQNILHLDPKAHTFGLLLNLNKIEGAGLRVGWWLGA